MSFDFALFSPQMEQISCIVLKTQMETLIRTERKHESERNRDLLRT